MKTASWWTRYFWTPRRIVDGPIRGFKIGHAYCQFTTFGAASYREGDGVRAPMESGRVALLRCTRSDTPCDPGDQHFYEFEFVRYLDVARGPSSVSPSRSTARHP